MALLTTPLKRKVHRIAADLRGMIKKNGCVPGSRLSGVRQLSEQFQASPNTVKSALDILQGERLIRCEHGRGIFVEPQTQDGEMEVYVLLWGLRREPCSYFEEITKIAYAPVIRPGFSFTLRTVFKDSEDFAHFDQELARIDNSPQTSCVLASSVQFNVEHFARLGKLHCPVVYFADSKYDDAVDVPRNRIIDSSDWTAAAVALLEREQAKEVTLFFPDGSIPFFREANSRLIMAASRQGMKLNLFEVPCSLFNEFDEAKISATYERIVNKAKNSGLLDCPTVVFGMINSIFLDLPQIRQRLEGKAPFIQALFSSAHLGEYYGALFELFAAVKAKPAEIHTRTVCNPVLVRDHANGANYLYKNEVLSKV